MGDTADDSMEIVHALRAVTVQLALRSAGFAQDNGMHPTDVRALIALMDARRAGEPMTAGRLGAQLGVNSAGTTAVVDRLERAGHVERVRDPADRRRVLVEVTEGAVALGQAHFGPFIETVVALLEGFDERERAAIRGFLDGARASASRTP
ncbi:MarR family winged helix-turn-helix transcriptional regulator [Streptomyces sp. VRA16 Mangrove soil]|uniref:MarR family winged helix-turn-helix transcriptional regulator n=1 Tax=Streptomyces sp. VRA16 Mangrove soil TaxID=2817434 RepID=UPI001A9F6B93|nr:MarR family transcriptional regulator [Streptomyces sp. VRA16 Mangrove soil]MBO1333276.1 MarR family transcriptional regulator [Streptomyces sp. VRA16 Mangrove soil]